jgi:hypothetical protein
MNKEELFLKYIDSQLTKEEKSELDQQLTSNEADKQLFEKVKVKKENVLNELDFLNPNESVEIPPFNIPLKITSTTKTILLRLWPYAAMVAILIGVYFGIKQFSTNTNHTIVDNQQEEVQTSKTIYKELDCYISPNRCWRQKQLNWTFIEITP